jgi:diacylglycerol kinase (ATP)
LAPGPLPWLAIINPKAGPRRPRGWHEGLARRLADELSAASVITRAPGEAAALARRAAESPVLVACGGDGTVAEVVRAMDLRRQALLVVPIGSGNGLARDLGLPRLGDALAAGARGRRVVVDLIDVRYQGPEGAGERPMISTAAVGYAADVVRLARGLRTLGQSRYAAAGAWAAAFRPRFTAELALDGRPDAPATYTNVMVHNTRHAGNFVAFPAAGLDDGRLDVLAVRAGFVGQTLHNVSALLRRGFYATGRPRQATEASLRLARPKALMVDGELVGPVDRADFRVRPGGLTCLA